MPAHGPQIAFPMSIAATKQETQAAQATEAEHALQAAQAKQPKKTKQQYKRNAKVPWSKIMSYYQQSHIFCLTHQESAGLAAIEAAMCGAKLYIPLINGKAFIKKELINPSISHSFISCSAEIIAAEILSDIGKQDMRLGNHQRIANKHDWSIAAARIYNHISRHPY